MDKAYERKPFHKTIHFYVLLAIVAGVGLGHLFPHTAMGMKPLGDGFIKLIKMVIGPIIFCTIVSGVAGMGDMKKVGRVGAKSLLYFEIVSTLALFLGLIAVHSVKPGVGMNIDASTLDTRDITAITTAGSAHSSVQFFLDIIPTTVFDAFAKGDILQILFFSLLFGSAMSHLGHLGKTILNVIGEATQALFKIVDMIMLVAPIGVFGAMAFTIGKYGIASLGPLAELLFLFYATCLVFVVVILGLIAKWAGFNVFRFIAYFKQELLVVLGTSSSESVLPKMMEKLERLGCAKPVVGLVIPAGYSFNLDGTSLYLSMAALFLAQATNTQLSFMQEATILAILLLTSKGASGVTGSAFLVLAATLSVVETIPVASLAIIFGIDRLLSTGRAVTNLVGNGVAAIVVSSWEKELNRETLARELNAGAAP